MLLDPERSPTFLRLALANGGLSKISTWPISNAPAMPCSRLSARFCGCDSEQGQDPALKNEVFRRVTVPKLRVHGVI